MQSAKSSPALDLDHAPGLMSLAARLAGGSQDAEDLVQATYVRALEAECVVEKRGSWLRRVLINEHNMDLRGRIRRDRRELRHGAAEDNVDMEHVLHCLEVGRVVQSLVNALDADVALVVRQRYFAGQSAAQIARDQKIPAGTVRWRLKSGLDELRQQLDRHYGGRRALWAGAVLPSGVTPTLSPTLSEGPASMGMSAGNISTPAAKGSPLMSFKILASAIALFTAGTGAALLTSAEEPDTTAPVSQPAAARPAAQVAPPDRAAAAKRAWQRRRAKIRSAAASAQAARPSVDTPSANPAEDSAPAVFTLCGDTPCAPDVLDAELGGCGDVHCLAGLVTEVTALFETCRPLLKDAPADLVLTAEVIGAPDVGTVVESVELTTEHETPEELSECLTEAMYALDLGARDAPFEETITVAVAGQGPGESPVFGDADPETLELLQRTLAGLEGEGAEGNVHTFHAGDDVLEVLGDTEMDDETLEAIEAAMASAGDGAEVRVMKLPEPTSAEE